MGCVNFFSRSIIKRGLAPARPDFAKGFASTILRVDACSYFLVQVGSFLCRTIFSYAVRLLTPVSLLSVKLQLMPISHGCIPWRVVSVLRVGTGSGQLPALRSRLPRMMAHVAAASKAILARSVHVFRLVLLL